MDEVTLQKKFALEPEELRQHCLRLLHAGLVEEVFDQRNCLVLQPTPFGRQWLGLIEQLDSLETADKSPYPERVVPKCESLPAAGNIAGHRVLQSYILSQAQVARLETLVKYEPQNKKLQRELAHYEQRRQALENLIIVSNEIEQL